MLRTRHTDVVGDSSGRSYVTEQGHNVPLLRTRALDRSDGVQLAQMFCTGRDDVSTIVRTEPKIEKLATSCRCVLTGTNR